MKRMLRDKRSVHPSARSKTIASQQTGDTFSKSKTTQRPSESEKYWKAIKFIQSSQKGFNAKDCYHYWVLAMLILLRHSELSLSTGRCIKGAATAEMEMPAQTRPKERSHWYIAVAYSPIVHFVEHLIDTKVACLPPLFVELSLLWPDCCLTILSSQQ